MRGVGEHQEIDVLAFAGKLASHLVGDQSTHGVPEEAVGPVGTLLSHCSDRLAGDVRDVARGSPIAVHGGHRDAVNRSGGPERGSKVAEREH